jgi:photosystem II stability/assembly factor-like uncharacterized protein
VRKGEAIVGLISIWFFNERLGWAAGFRDNEPLIVSTGDGGENWKETYIRDDLTRVTQSIRRIRFADALHGWALGPGAIFYTDDGGSIWNPQYASDEGVFLNELAVLGPEQVWAVGGRGFLLHTTDHGATWSRVSWLGTADDFLWTIAFADTKNGWIAGGNGVIFSTRNGGDTWERQVSPVQGMLVGIAVTSSLVFITGDAAGLLVSQR